MLVLIYLTVLEVQGLEISQKTPSNPNYEEI